MQPEEEKLSAATKRKLQKLHRACGHSPKVLTMLRLAKQPAAEIKYFKKIREQCPECQSFDWKFVTPKAGTVQLSLFPRDVAAVDIKYLKDANNETIRCYHILDLCSRHSFGVLVRDTKAERDGLLQDQYLAKSLADWADGPLEPSILIGFPIMIPFMSFSIIIP